MAECLEDSEVDVEAIIREIMQEKKVFPEEIEEEEPFVLKKFLKNLKNKKKSQRYFRGRAYCQFKCQDDSCGHSWSSNRAWCILDLKEQRIEQKLKEECSLYKNHPNFKEMSLSNSDKSDDSDGDCSIENNSSDGDCSIENNSSDGDCNIENGGDGGFHIDSNSSTKIYFDDESVGAYPRFEDEESVRHMVEWAVNLHLVLVGRKEKEIRSYDKQRQTNGPHEQSLCEMCQEMNGPCW